MSYVLQHQIECNLFTSTSANGTHLKNGHGPSLKNVPSNTNSKRHKSYGHHAIAVEDMDGIDEDDERYSEDFHEELQNNVAADAAIIDDIVDNMETAGGTPEHIEGINRMGLRHSRINSDGIEEGGRLAQARARHEDRTRLLAARNGAARNGAVALQLTSDDEFIINGDDHDHETAGDQPQ